MSGQDSCKQECCNQKYVVAVPESNEVVIIDENSNILKSYPAKNTYDAWIKDNGDIVYCNYKGIQVVNKKGKIKLDYKTENEIFSCQPLKNNHYLVGNCSEGKLLEINKNGEVVKRIQLSYEHGGHACFRGARKLDTGNYLVSHYADKVVREYDTKGLVVREFKRPNNVYAAERLPNGNTIISDQYTISIYGPEGNLGWEWDGRDCSQLGINHLTGFKYLKNNEIIICNWLGHPPYKKGVEIFKINLDKKITWKSDFEKSISCANINLK